MDWTVFTLSRGLIYNCLICLLPIPQVLWLALETEGEEEDAKPKTNHV